MDIGLAVNCETKYYLPEINRAIVAMIGETKRRMIETVNPIYWIMMMLFLPSRIVEYFGGKRNSLFTKLLNFAYWLIPLIVTIFSNDIRTFFVNLFFDINLGG